MTFDPAHQHTVPTPNSVKAEPCLDCFYFCLFVVVFLLIFQSKRRFERDCKEAERAQHVSDKIDLDNKTDGEKVRTLSSCQGECGRSLSTPAVI